MDRVLHVQEEMDGCVVLVDVFHIFLMGHLQEHVHLTLTEKNQTIKMLENIFWGQQSLPISLSPIKN